MRKLPTEILVFRIEPDYDDGDDNLSNTPVDTIDSDSGNSND